MRVPAVMMRGGTSRGLFFHERDLPTDPEERDRLILGVYGSPDPYRLQVDGVGGATSNTSKVAIIAPGDGDVDVRYTFGQVSIDRPLIDWAGNCGNISSAVGPFAVDEGLVPATEPMTTVRFLNTNTDKVIVAHVPSRDGRFDPRGDLLIPGVPRPGAPVQLDYLDPGGAVTGRLLPTGSPTDVIRHGDHEIVISIVDAANPLVFVPFPAVGLTGAETAAELNADAPLLASLATIRATAGVLMGLADTPEEVLDRFPSVPKLALVGRPIRYRKSDGVEVAAEEMDLKVTMLSMGPAHSSIALTGAICTAVAVKIPGTVAGLAAGGPIGAETTRIGHPAGVLAVAAEPLLSEDRWVVDHVAVFRTARRLFEGAVFSPSSARPSAPRASGSSRSARRSR